MAKKGYNFDWGALEQKIKEDRTKKKGGDKDERFWTPTKDENKTAIAVIRFLPSLSGEPFVKVHNHFFHFLEEGQKKWWVKPCPSTISKTCLVCKKNFEYWESAFESDKDIARKRKRSTKYIANIYVIKDPNNPESEGTVKMFEFGVKIFDKIMRHWMPSETDMQDPDFQQFVPFDPDNGANFKLKIKQVGDYPNYDDSSFSPCSEFLGGDEKKVMSVLEKCYDLGEFLKPENFPSESEQREKLGGLLGETRAASEESGDDDGIFNDEPEKSSSSKTKGESVEKIDEAFEEPASTKKKEKAKPAEVVDEDDDEAFFKDLS